MARCVRDLEDPDLVEVIEGNRELDARRWIFTLIKVSHMMISSKC